LISFHIDAIDVVTTNVGRVSTKLLVTTLNTGFRVVIPLVNDFLQQYEVVIPSEILGLISLSDLYLEYYDGYAYFGATPTFIEQNAIEAFVQ